MLNRLLAALLSVPTLLTAPGLPVLTGPPALAQAAPAASSASAASGRAGAVWHVVQPGETMASIAAAAGLDAARVGRWNQIVAPYPVHVDETLRLTAPRYPLHDWRTKVQLVSPGMVNWVPARACPVLPINLRKVWVSYIDLQGYYHDGSIVVRKDLTARVQNIFLTLFRWRYRIMAMAPMSVNMPGQTDMSIVTAGYNCRPVAGTRVWSEHAYGTAIDINPLQNPMIRGRLTDPGAGVLYRNRTRHLLGMVHSGGAVRAFANNGYYWGGSWTNLKDYMHFSSTNR